MKKLVSIALALVLTLGLVGPAMAVEEDYDPLPEDWWMDDYIDPWEEYAQAHPEEMAGLDQDQLLAGWGYHDMTAGEVFWKEMYYSSADMTEEELAEAVRTWYLSNRVHVQSRREEAEQAKADYPEAWATFDADSFFEYSKDDYGSTHWNCTKDEYMARENILTEEEFVDLMFCDYSYYLPWREPNWWLMPDPVKPTLTLYVNGVATDVEVTAGEGVTYADADALRQFFGPEAVPETASGPLPIRETAAKAGWDVVWYDGGWWSGEQEVQLWDKASYLAALEKQFPKELVEFVAGSAVNPETGLLAETPTTSHRTITADVTRFSTLDGDKTYPLTFEADVTTGGGVLDVTVTFDVSELLKLFNTDALESVTKLGGFSVTQLRQFLKAGVMEFIFDYNTGEVAYNVPLLALVDEDLAGWQTMEVPGYAESLARRQELLANTSWGEMLYQMLLSVGESVGAEEALSQYTETTALLSVFLGEDRFTTRGNTFTYTLDTDTVNELMTTLIAASEDMDGAELPTLHIFKTFEITGVASGDTFKTDLHIRPDMDGIASAVAKAYESSYFYDDSSSGVMELVMGWIMKIYDMDLTASSQGSAKSSTGSMELHWNNVGKLTVRTTATQTSGKAPRSIDDIVK